MRERKKTKAFNLFHRTMAAHNKMHHTEEGKGEIS